MLVDWLPRAPCGEQGSEGYVMAWGLGWSSVVNHRQLLQHGQVVGDRQTSSNVMVLVGVFLPFGKGDSGTTLSHHLSCAVCVRVCTQACPCMRMHLCVCQDTYTYTHTQARKHTHPHTHADDPGAGRRSIVRRSSSQALSGSPRALPLAYDHNSKLGLESWGAEGEGPFPVKQLRRTSSTVSNSNNASPLGRSGGY